MLSQIDIALCLSLYFIIFILAAISVITNARILLPFRYYHNYYNLNKNTR